MPADAFVLVHGGFHDSRCWERLIPLLRRPALAVDLPGRGTRPAKMADVTLEACVRSVVADIEQAGLSRVVLVGHSMGGGTVPVVAARIPQRIAHLVLLSTLVAPEDGSLVDGFVPETREAAIRRLGTGENVELELSDEHHRELLCNDMSEADVAWCLARVGPRFAEPLHGTAPRARGSRTRSRGPTSACAATARSAGRSRSARSPSCRGSLCARSTRRTRRW